MRSKIAGLVIIVAAVLAVGLGSVVAAGHTVGQHTAHQMLADDTGPTVVG